MTTSHPQDEAPIPEGESGFISPGGETRPSPESASPPDAAVLFSIFQRAGAGLCLVGPDNRVVAANPLWFESSGLAEPEVVGRLIHEVLSMPRETAFSLYARVRAGQTVQMPRHSHLVQGVNRWWDGSVSPVPMAGGTGILITVRDISEQVVQEQRQEELLLEVQRRALELDAVIESIGDGVVIVDLNGRILKINPAGQATLSAGSFDQIPTDMNAFAILRPTLPDGTPISVEGWPIHRLLRGERVVDQERLVTTPGGEIRRIMLSASPVRGKDGEIILGVVVFRDITESKEIETERERLLAQLDATIGSIADGIAVFAPDGSMTFMNEGAWRILGYSHEAWNASIEDRARTMEIRTARGDLFSSDEMPTARALRGETSQGVTMSIRRPDGSVVWVSASAAPIRTSSGAVLGAVATFADITRIQELQEQREDFIRTISHDLRNPLTPIMGQSGILSRLLRTEGRERDARAADMILTNAHRMNSMIEDLVESVRLDSGQVPLRRRLVDLCHLVSDLSERVGSHEDRGRLQLHCPSQPCLVEVDPERLERVITNLLTNAFKYSAPGSPVWLKVQPGDGEVALAVSDQGSGIAPEDLPHIFQRYYRSRVWQSGEGLGLGLYIARLLVEAHGGRISVESSAGAGSTFRVSLPLSSPS